MKTITFTIAGIPLNVKYRSIRPNPPFLRRFQADTKQPDNHIWQMESLPLGRINPPLNSGHFLFKKRLDNLRKRFSPAEQFFNFYRRKQNILTSLCLRYNKIPSLLSFYFDDAVEINLKERKIRHFYLRGRILNGINGLDQRLITFVYSQILAFEQGFLLHAACAAKEGKAYLFLAPSGGGKSTVAKLSKRYSVLGDDIIAVRKINHEFFAFPTPWKQGKFFNPHPSSQVKIQAIFFLEKASSLYLKPVKPEQALTKTLSTGIHFFLYTERPLAEKIFFTAANFFKAIPAYKMHFRKDDNFWPMIDKVSE